MTPPTPHPLSLGPRAFTVRCGKSWHGTQSVIATSRDDARKLRDRVKCDCGYRDVRAKREGGGDQ